jgi:hypothetical protein
MGPEVELLCLEPATGARWIQSTPSHSTSIRPVLISSPNIRKGLKWFLPFISSDQILWALPNTHAYDLSRPSCPSWVDRPNNICGRAQVMTLLTVPCFRYPVISSLRLDPNIHFNTLFSNTLICVISLKQGYSTWCSRAPRCSFDIG